MSLQGERNTYHLYNPVTDLLPSDVGSALDTDPHSRDARYRRDGGVRCRRLPHASQQRSDEPNPALLAGGDLPVHAGAKLPLGRKPFCEAPADAPHRTGWARARSQRATGA